MNRLILYCLVLLSEKSICAVWEFGNDIEDSYILASYKGEGPILEKFKQLQFYLPHCYYTVYVRVEVDNPVMLPKVVYNWEDNSVMFQYKKTDEESVSKYYVIAKGKYRKNCKHSKIDDVKIRPDIIKSAFAHPVFAYSQNNEQLDLLFHSR